MNSEDRGSERAALERRVARLAADRTTLFRAANARGGLSAEEQQRLMLTERELDECYNALRRDRAQRESRRFVRDSPMGRLSTEPRRRPKSSSA